MLTCAISYWTSASATNTNDFNIDELMDFVSEKLGYNIRILRQVPRGYIHPSERPLLCPYRSHKNTIKGNATISIQTRTTVFFKNELTTEEISNLRLYHRDAEPLQGHTGQCVAGRGYFEPGIPLWV